MFFNTIGFSIIESMVTVILSDKWGFSLDDSIWPFVIAGFMLFLTAIIVKILSTPSFVFLLLGSLLMGDYQTLRFGNCRQFDNNESKCISNDSCIWNPSYQGHNCNSCAEICWNRYQIMNIYQFVIGFCLSNIGFQIGRISIPTMIVKLVPKTQVPNVVSWLILCQSISRILAPLYALQFYQQFERTTFALMLSLGGFYIFCLCVQILFYKKMNPNYYQVTESQPLIFK